MAVEDINVIIEDANETVSVTVNEITEEVTVIVNDFSVSKIVSQTITDGVTDMAPSEDAVYDALSTKVDKTTTLNINGNSYDLTSDIEWRVAQADTGVLEFGGLSYNSSTAINIGAVKGYAVDNETDPLNPSYVFIDYPGQTGVTVTTLGSGIGTIVLLIPDGNGGGTVVFQNELPDSAQRKTHLWLGKVGHPTGIIATPTAVINEPDYITSPQAFSRDLFQVLGPYINDGVIAYPNGANLQINITAGNIHGNGINFHNDRTRPNEVATGPHTPLSFLYRTRTGAGGGLVSTITPNSYDVGGVVTTVGGGANNSTLQYIFCVPGSGFIIQYGQTIYANLSAAIEAVGRESFAIYANLPNNSILIGVLAIVRTATALNNTAQAQFFPADKLGQIIGATSGISTGTRQTSYNNSLQPQTIVSDTLGADTWRSGRALNSSPIMQWENIAGSNTASINGNGDFTANKFIKQGGLSTEFLMADGSVSSGGGGSVLTTNTNITSANLSTQDVAGFVAYINGLVSSFSVATNEDRYYTVTDTGQKFLILLRGRSFGGSEPDILTSDVLEIEKNTTEDLYRSWFSQTANNAGGLIALNTTTTLTVSGTNSVVARGGTTFYNSLIMNNYLSLAASGSNAGIKNTLNAEGYFLEGVDAYFIFANNDAATGCATAVGFYSLLAAIPNLDPTNFTANTVLVGNDAGDTNLSFFVNRTAATPSFVKIPCGADFPAHTTSDAYLFRIEIPKTALQANRYAILTLTNIVTGKVFSTTVTGSQLPDTTMSFSSVINRSNRNTGVATNIRASKINVSRLLY